MLIDYVRIVQNLSSNWSRSQDSPDSSKAKQVLAKMSIFIAHRAAGYKRVLSNVRKFEDKPGQHSKVLHPSKCSRSTTSTCKARFFSSTKICGGLYEDENFIFILSYLQFN